MWLIFPMQVFLRSEQQQQLSIPFQANKGEKEGKNAHTHIHTRRIQTFALSGKMENSFTQFYFILFDPVSWYSPHRFALFFFFFFFSFSPIKHCLKGMRHKMRINRNVETESQLTNELNFF